MEDNISQKQGYLYHEIIEAGYNPQSFQQFIITQNPQKGMDLSLWTMNQLKSLILKFKSTIDSQNEVQIQIKNEIECEKQPKSQKILISNKQDDYYKVIQCVKFKQEQVNQINPSTVIVIDKFQQKTGGLFEKNYIVFHIKTDTLKSNVMRRYTDFQTLRQALQILYPGTPLPPLAKKGKMSRKDQKHLFKRLYILQKFLNRILMISDIRSSNVFYKFLTSKDTRDIENQKLKFKKIKHIPLQKIQNSMGFVQVKIDQKTNNIISKAQKYFAGAQPQIKKIYKDFKGAATALESCAQHFIHISNNCRNLNKNYLQFHKQCNFPSNKINIFVILSEMTQRYSQLIKEQAKIFRKQIYSMVKYESFLTINFIESLQKLANMKTNFLDHKLTLLKRKQKLYQQGNISKWNTSQKLTTKPERQEAYAIMLPKQTNQLLKQRDQYALYNYQTYKQIERSLKQNDKIIQKYLQQIFQLQSSISGRVLIIWADLMILAKQMSVSAG